MTTTPEQEQFISQQTTLFSQLQADRELQTKRLNEDHRRLQTRAAKPSLEELWKIEDDKRKAARQAQIPINASSSSPLEDYHPIWKAQDTNRVEGRKLNQQEREQAYKERKKNHADFIKNLTSPHFKAIAHFSSFITSAKYELSSIARSVSYKLEDAGRNYIFRKAILAIEAISPIAQSIAQPIKKAANGLYETGENMARAIYRSLYPLGVKFEEKFEDITRWVYRKTQDLNPVAAVQRSMELEAIHQMMKENENTEVRTKSQSPKENLTLSQEGDFSVVKKANIVDIKSKDLQDLSISKPYNQCHISHVNNEHPEKIEMQIREAVKPLNKAQTNGTEAVDQRTRSLKKVSWDSALRLFGKSTPSPRSCGAKHEADETLKETLHLSTS